MADCSTCKEKQKQAEPIPYIAFVSMKSTMERTIKRLWILLIILVVLLMGSNIAWIIYESSFIDEETEVTQEVETGDGSAYVAGIGSIYYGESETNSQETETNP